MNPIDELKAADDVVASPLTVSIGALGIATRADRYSSCRPGYLPPFFMPQDLEITYKGEPLPMERIEFLGITIQYDQPVRCEIRFLP